MYYDFAKKLGERVKSIREEKGLSQEDVALEADISRGYVGMLERAERSLTIRKIYQVSRALKVDFSSLFDFDDLEL